MGKKQPIVGSIWHKTGSKKLYLACRIGDEQYCLSCIDDLVEGRITICKDIGILSDKNFTRTKIIDSGFVEYKDEVQKQIGR